MNASELICHEKLQLCIANGGVVDRWIADARLHCDECMPSADEVAKMRVDRIGFCVNMGMIQEDVWRIISSSHPVV